jgi:hypothetical protein
MQKLWKTLETLMKKSHLLLFTWAATIISGVVVYMIHFSVRLEQSGYVAKAAGIFIFFLSLLVLIEGIHPSGGGSQSLNLIFSAIWKNCNNIFPRKVQIIGDVIIRIIFIILRIIYIILGIYLMVVVAIPALIYFF